LKTTLTFAQNEELDELELTPETERTEEQARRVAFLQEHIRIAQTQWDAYHSAMKDLVDNPSRRLIVQDFNQQHGNQSLQTQVLSIVVYGAPHGSVERHYYNYFLPVQQSNNLTAVIACHRDLFLNPANTFIAEATHFDVFNDGGPKHFKLTGYLAHMAEISNRLRERNVSTVQHYFASYHGSGPADAVASHLKRKIKVTREEFHKSPQTVQDMARICSSIANTDKAAALVMPTDLLDAESHVEVRTLAGIKSYHKVTFTGQ